MARVFIWGYSPVDMGTDDGCPPVGSTVKTPVKDLGDEVTQKLKHFAVSIYKF